MNWSNGSLALCSVKEIELMLCGSDSIDVDDWGEAHGVRERLQCRLQGGEMVLGTP